MDYQVWQLNNLHGRFHGYMAMINSIERQHEVFNSVCSLRVFVRMAGRIQFLTENSAINVIECVLAIIRLHATPH
jgi:hypothetical protein